MKISRRTVIGGGVALPVAACATASGVKSKPSGPRVIVVGAGVFGAWTAEHLQRAGADVLLVDQAGPSNSRASSGGESRMIRAAYGADSIYTEMAFASLPEWKALSDADTSPLFHPCGVLMFFEGPSDYADQSIAVHEALGLPLERMDREALERRWPQISFEGIEFGVLEPGFGALMARRAVQSVVARFVEKGGRYRIARVEPNAGSGRIVKLNGEDMAADAVVYACGPWLKTLFPELLSQRLFVTRQEAAYVATPDGDARFGPAALPGWAEIGDDVYYGFPDLESRGFKIAFDNHGPDFDPDTGSREMSEDGQARLHAYIERRFPALAGRPFTEFRVCQYTNSSNGDFLIDRHPGLEGAFLLGAGSGHGFKHGPEIGRRMAELVLDTSSAPEPRFSLETKLTTHNREVL